MELQPPQALARQRERVVAVQQHHLDDHRLPEPPQQRHEQEQFPTQDDGVDQIDVAAMAHHEGPDLEQPDRLRQLAAPRAEDAMNEGQIPRSIDGSRLDAGTCEHERGDAAIDQVRQHRGQRHAVTAEVGRVEAGAIADAKRRGGGEAQEGVIPGM